MFSKNNDKCHSSMAPDFSSTTSDEWFGGTSQHLQTCFLTHPETMVPTSHRANVWQYRALVTPPSAASLLGPHPTPAFWPSVLTQTFMSYAATVLHARRCSKSCVQPLHKSTCLKSTLQMKPTRTRRGQSNLLSGNLAPNPLKTLCRPEASASRIPPPQSKTPTFKLYSKVSVKFQVRNHTH